MNPLWIALAVFAVFYVGVNVRRLAQGRRWAFSFCQAAREWDQAEREREAAARRTRDYSAQLQPDAVSPSARQASIVGGCQEPSLPASIPAISSSKGP